MNILHVFRTPVGGLFRHVCDLAAEQTARGHGVGAIYDSSTGDALSTTRIAALSASCGLGLHPLPMSRAVSFGDVGALLGTRHLVRRLGVDIVHGHGAKGGAFARLAAATLPATGMSRPSTFYTLHGGSLHYHPGSIAGRVFLGLERTLDRWTDGLVFESVFSAQAYAAKVGQTRAASRIVPNGLQQAEFVAVEPAKDAADFLYIGELRHLKGVDVLLRALARLDATPGHGDREVARPATPTACSRAPTAVIVGAGPDAQAFQSLARELGLGDRVRFAGAMPARQAFALGRTLVVPSRAESFPYIVLEAAAAGLPMLATNVGGIPEILAGSGVSMVPPDDIAALAGAMSIALARPAFLASGARALRDCVGARFTVARMAESLLSFYTDASASAGVASPTLAIPSRAH